MKQLDNQVIRLKNYQTKNRLKVSEIAEKLNISTPLLYKLYNGTRNLTENMYKEIDIIIGASDVETSVLSEEGQPYNKKAKKNTYEFRLDNTYVTGYIPFYDRDVTASKMELFEDKAIPPSLLYYLPNFSDCTAIFPIYGDSMYPRFRAGDRVVVKEYPHFQQYIQYGEVFLVFTVNEERMIKIVRKSQQPGFIKLVSVNQEYDDFEMPLSTITKMFMVKGKICIEND